MRFTRIWITMTSRAFFSAYSAMAFPLIRMSAKDAKSSSASSASKLMIVLSDTIRVSGVHSVASRYRSKKWTKICNHWRLTIWDLNMFVEDKTIKLTIVVYSNKLNQLKNSRPSRNSSSHRPIKKSWEKLVNCLRVTIKIQIILQTPGWQLRIKSEIRKTANNNQLLSKLKKYIAIMTI